MVEPIVLEFKIDDIYIDNPLLSKNDLLKYDTEYCYDIEDLNVNKNYGTEEEPIKAFNPVVTTYKHLAYSLSNSKEEKETSDEMEK